MAQLSDLIGFGKDVLPLIKDLVKAAGKDEDKPDNGAETHAVSKLRKFVKAANQRTPAPVAERAEAIQSVRSALTEILLSAASSNGALSTTTTRTIQTRRNALRNAFGLLLERAAFEPIATLLPQTKIDKIVADLDGAETEINQRQKAKKTLDFVVKAVITAAQIAAKIA